MADRSIRYSARQAGRAHEVLKWLQSLRRAVRFYPLEHPSVIENATALCDAIRTYHDEGVGLQLAFFEGEILLGDQLLAEESVTYDQLARDLEAIGVGSLLFSPGLTSEELKRAAVVLGADEAGAQAAGGILRMAQAADLPHVEIGLVRAVAESTATDEGMAHDAFIAAVNLMREVEETHLEHGEVSSANVRPVVKSLVDVVLRNRYLALRLAGLKNLDEYTFYHSVNVAILSLALGSAITDDETFLTMLGTSALLHDIGKLAVGRDITRKEGQLNAEEWDAMRQHPVLGAEMVLAMSGIDRAVVVPVLEHHLRFAGGGYPKPALDRPLHLASRIIAVADAYDAMTSRRSYSAARVRDEAMSQLVANAGTALDPVLVRLFVAMLGVYPPHTVVRLSSGEVAIVVAPADGEPLRPTVRVISSPDGELIEPFDLPLAERDDVSVECTLDPRLLDVEVQDYV